MMLTQNKKRVYLGSSINFINDEAVGPWVGTHHCPHLCCCFNLVGECLHTSIITGTPFQPVCTCGILLSILVVVIAIENFISRSMFDPLTVHLVINLLYFSSSVHAGNMGWLTYSVTQVRLQQLQEQHYPTKS